MGFDASLFSQFAKPPRDKDFDVEANAPPQEPPLVAATPINYGVASVPPPAQAINNDAIHQQHVATHKAFVQTQQLQQQQQYQQFQQPPTTPPQQLQQRPIQQMMDQPPPLGRHPTSISQCPHCGATNVNTRASTFPGVETWLAALGLLFLFWPVCWIPLVTDSAKRTDHICTRCQAVVGTVKPFSDCCKTDRG